MPDELEAVPPFLFIDNGNWINIYESFSDLIDDLEGPFLDEIAFLVDGHGRSITLATRDDRIEVESVASVSDLLALQACVDRFFKEWTTVSAPRHDLSISGYISTAVEAYRSATFRHKRKRV